MIEKQDIDILFPKGKFCNNGYLSGVKNSLFQDVVKQINITGDTYGLIKGMLINAYCKEDSSSSNDEENDDDDWVGGSYNNIDITNTLQDIF